MAEDRARLQSLTDEYQDLQNDLSNLVSARQKLESQQQENQSVQKEFSTLADDATIYKLVGPVLLKQETSEAKSTVVGRLDFIGKEIARIEGNIKDIQTKSEEKKMEILRIQTALQQQQQPQGGAPASAVAV